MTIGRVNRAKILKKNSGFLSFRVFFCGGSLYPKCNQTLVKGFKQDCNIIGLPQRLSGKKHTCNTEAVGSIGRS